MNNYIIVLRSKQLTLLLQLMLYLFYLHILCTYSFSFITSYSFQNYTVTLSVIVHLNFVIWTDLVFLLLIHNHYMSSRSSTAKNITIPKIVNTHCVVSQLPHITMNRLLSPIFNDSSFYDFYAKAYF